MTVSTKQQILNMGLNVWALDLLIESYNSATKKLLDNNSDFPKDKLNLAFTLDVKDRSDRNGKVRVTIEKIFE